MTGTSPATPALLWSRAVLLATVVVAVSVLGHVSADGNLPGVLALVLLLAVTTAVSSVFLVRQASALRVVTLLVVGQGVIHGALTLLAGHGATRSARPAVGPPAHHDHAAGAVTGRLGHSHGPAADAASASGPASGKSLLAHVVDDLAEQGAAMLFAHLAAVVLIGLWLAVGERALWTLVSLAATDALRALAARLADLLGQPLRWLLERVRRVSFPRAAARLVVPRPHLLPQVVARRGPPALLAS